MAGDARGLAMSSRCVFPVGGVDYPVDPVHIAGHLGVYARPVGSGAAVTVTRDAVQGPTTV